MTSLARYHAGQHRQVWTELLGVGPHVRNDESLAEEAEAIARETMERVRRNVERLRHELPQLGFVFANPDAVLTPPSANVIEAIMRVERVVGPLPLSVPAFWTVVGSVDLSGMHRDWPHRLLDPLMVEFDADYVIDTYEDMIEQGAHSPGEPFALDFAPDDLHKADISGGPPYAIEVPNARVDGLVVWEIHQTTFVNYLRTVMQFAGLGGLSPTKRHGHQVLPVPSEVLELAAQLEPF